jgi:hypothetical protein
MDEVIARTEAKAEAKAIVVSFTVVFPATFNIEATAPASGAG